MARLGGGTTTDTTSTSNELYYAGEAFRLAYDVGTGTGSRRVPTSFIGYTIEASAVAVQVTGDDLTTAVPIGTCTISGTDTMTIKSECSGTWVQKSVNLVNATGDTQLLDGHCTNSAASVVTGITDSASCIPKGDCLYNSAGVAQPSADQQVNSAAVCLTRKQIVTTSATELAVGDFVPNTFVTNPEKDRGIFYIFIPSDILNEVGFTTNPEPGSPQYIAYSISYTESSVDRVDPETRVIETDVIGFQWTPMYNVTTIDGEDLSNLPDIS